MENSKVAIRSLQNWLDIQEWGYHEYAKENSAEGDYSISKWRWWKAVDKQAVAAAYDAAHPIKQDKGTIITEVQASEMEDAVTEVVEEAEADEGEFREVRELSASASEFRAFVLDDFTAEQEKPKRKRKVSSE